MLETPQVQDKAPKPEGLLPKNVQSWLLVGLAFLMVAIMWLTGGKKPQPARSASSAAPVAPPLEVNETKIAELQSRIEELQRQQLVAQSALAQQTRLLDGPQDSPPSQPSGATPSGEEPHEDPIQAERNRRAYVSLFASNVALSYRKTPAAPTPPAETSAPSSAAPRGRDASRDAVIEGNAIESGSGGHPPHNDSAEKLNDRKEEPKNPAAVAAGAANAAAGKTYLLFEGTILETVLINRLDGGFGGPVQCLLSTDVYSNDRQHLLIPAGSKLLGETKKVDTFGQTRLAVVFHRVLMPDGYSVSLDQFKGLNQIGDTGLRDQVNNHYLRIFGVSLAIGGLGAVAEGGTAGSLNASGSDLMRQGFAQGTAQSSAQILDKFLNIMPTVTIREGHRVKVYLSGDLALPDYNNHTDAFRFVEGAKRREGFMKRKILICLLVLGLGVGTATAQFGNGVVFDPTNYHNALLRYYQLQQHLIELQKSYAKITGQLNLALQMAQFVKNMPARYRALFSQWRKVTSLNTFGNTVSWINGINTGVLPNINTGYLQSTSQLAPYSSYELSGMDPLGTGPRAIPVRVGRTRRRRQYQCHGDYRRDSRHRRRYPNANRKSRTGFFLGRRRSQQRSVRSQQDQCRGRPDAAHPAGFEQTSRLAFGTTDHPRETTA